MEEFRQKLILAAFTALISDPKSQLTEHDIAGYAVGYADATIRKAYPAHIAHLPSEDTTPTEN